MFSTKNPQKISKMRCLKFPDSNPDLLIINISASPKKQGLGTKMLSFASKFSKSIGCNGKFHLIASSIFSKNEAPHIFYRKFGMTTGDKALDYKLDEFIRLDKKATCNDFKDIEMYYHP